MEFETQDDLGGVNLQFAMSLPGEKILWAKRVPAKSTFRKGSGVFGLAIAAPIIFLVLCICQLIFVSVEGSQSWAQWILMICTLACVLVLYLVFLWNKLIGVRIDVVTNLRVANVVVRSADNIEKSFIPLTSIGTVYAGDQQVTFNTRRPAFRPDLSQIATDDEGDVRKPLVGGYRPSNKFVLRGPHHARLAVQFTHVDDPEALKSLVVNEKARLRRNTDSSNPAVALMQREWSYVDADVIPEEYRQLAAPYLANGEKILKVFQPSKFKRWIFGRRMPFVIGFTLWLLVFAYWLGDTHTSFSSNKDGTGSGSTPLSAANKRLLIVIAVLLALFAICLPPLWIILDNSVAGVDCMLEKSGILFLRKGSRRDQKMFCGANAILTSYEDILPITLDKDEMNESGYVYLRGLETNSELVDVDNMNDFESIVMQKIFNTHLRVDGDSSSSSSSAPAVSDHILRKYETADPSYGEL